MLSLSVKSGTVSCLLFFNVNSNIFSLNIFKLHMHQSSLQHMSISDFPEGVAASSF